MSRRRSRRRTVRRPARGNKKRAPRKGPPRDGVDKTETGETSTRETAVEDTPVRNDPAQAPTPAWRAWTRYDRGYTRAALGVMCLLLTLPPRFAREPATQASPDEAEAPLVYEGDDGERIRLTSPDEVTGDVHVTAWNGDTIVARRSGPLPLELDLPTEGALWLRVEAPGRARYLERVVPVGGRPLVIPMPPGATLSGEVVDETGATIRDATVEFVRSEGPRAPWTTETDEAGRFTIDTLVEGSYRVGAASPGHATVATRATAGGPPLRLTLERVGLIAGRVMDAEGHPVPRAQLVIAGSGLWPARQAQSDARGRFVLPDIPPGVYEVRATTDEGAAAPRRGIDLGPGDQRFLTFTLRAGRAIAGVVRDASDGSPVEGAELTLASEALGVAPARHHDERRGALPHRRVGRGHLSSLDPRERLCAHRRARRLARHAGGHPSRPRRHRRGHGRGRRRPSDRGRAAGGHRGGRGAPADRDARRQRVPGQRVRAPARPGRAGPGRAAPSGDAHRARPDADRSGQLARDRRRRAPPARGDLGATAGGRDRAGAHDADGAPRVTDARLGRERRVPHRGGAAPGRVQIVARMAGLAPATSPRVFVEVGGESAPIELVLRPAGTLVGQVLDTRAVGVGGVLVEARSDREPHPRVVMTDPRGHFRFDAVIGELTVTAQPREQPAVRARALVESEQETELSLTLEGALFALAGRCVDARGFPVPDASLTLTSLRADAPLSRTLFSAADGTFEAVGLPAPPWRVQARGTADLAPTQVDVFEASDALTVTLEPGAAVVATVRDAWTDAPLSGTAELIQDGLPSEVLEARVFEGALRFSRVRPGAWRLVVRSVGHLETEAAVQVRLLGGDAVDVTLDPVRLEPASTLSGTVIDALGHPVARAAVQVDEAITLTDGNGEFSLPGLNPGQVTALASHPAAGASESAALTLRRGEETPGAVLRLPDVYDAANAPPLPPRRRGVAVVAVFTDGQARIGSVVDGSRAARAGLRAGDRLVRIDGDTPENLRQTRALLSGAVTVPAVITVARDGEEATLMVPRESWLPE